MVTASRRHLTERYAAGVDRLLWDTEKRIVPDLDAIRSVIDAASSGHAEALDIGAGLVLLQAARLEVDRLEYDVFESAHAMGMGEEAIAAVLDLPDAAAAGKRRRWLRGRRALPYADIGLGGRRWPLVCGGLVGDGLVCGSTTSTSAGRSADSPASRVRSGSSPPAEAATTRSRPGPAVMTSRPACGGPASRPVSRHVFPGIPLSTRSGGSGKISWDQSLNAQRW
jgi:hypothetical protein